MGSEKTQEFHRVGRLPPYVFAVINELKDVARRRGEEIYGVCPWDPTAISSQT